MTSKKFKETLKDKLENMWHSIQDFFEEWGGMIIAIAITIVLVAGVVIGGYALLHNALKKESIEKWNDGICTVCGGKYELYTISRGIHYYVCENCKHEIDCLGAMR